MNATSKKHKTQEQQVIEAMRINGGYATFEELNRLVDFSSWGTKTPEASVRRIVQQSKECFRICPGLWALKECQEHILKRFRIQDTKEKTEQQFTHSYYQGLVVDIGNMKNFETYIPPQDKNKMFLDKPLRTLATVEPIYQFTYAEILGRAKTVDVIWFNDRKLPDSFFEVEHSTDIQNSLAKFCDLQDYYACFHIVADKSRESQFTKILERSIFKPLHKRVKFCRYEDLRKQHAAMRKLKTIAVI